MDYIFHVKSKNSSPNPRLQTLPPMLFEKNKTSTILCFMFKPMIHFEQTSV